MKRITLLVLALVLLLAACSPASPLPSGEGQGEGVPATPAPATQTLDTEPPDTETPDSSITIVDALNRTVTLPDVPQRIVITGKALFMIADAAYLFPQAMEKIIGLGDAGQGSGNFIKLIDPNYAAKQTLAKDAGAEQVAALKPDLVILLWTRTSCRPSRACCRSGRRKTGSRDNSDYLFFLCGLQLPQRLHHL
ncbi:MAG: hypothetical protein Fur0016_31050 [Anaerolineales bacterium]